MRRLSSFPLTLFLALSLLAVMAGLAVAVDKPAPGRDVMDSPIPPGETPGGQAKKMKVCPDGECGSVVPVWSHDSGFVGLDGQGLGYCVSYTLPDGTVGRVDVPFHRPDPKDPEALRQSVSNAIRALGGAHLSRCMERASKKPLHAQAQAAEVCRAQAAQVERRAGGVTFAWEGRPFSIVGTDPGPRCTCATLIHDPGTVGSQYACGGACGNCISCL